MADTVRRRTSKLTVIAQDPAVRDPAAPKRKQIVRAAVDVPAEALDSGPGGYRVNVVDYDVSQDILYKPFAPDPEKDLFEDATDRQLLMNPHFHCQNVYALVMRTLARFEFALGRRVSWGFRGHQLNIVPHAFAEANAFYSPDDQALLFGYFPSPKNGKFIYTCLSHDVVVHEATHALLDGLRERYTDPSSADQAAFHEGFADIVALLSVFSLRGVAGRVIDLASETEKKSKAEKEFIAKAEVRVQNLRRSGLLGLAEEFGKQLAVVRGNALRRSVEDLWPPKPDYYQSDPEFDQPHRRGEILVAAVLNAFLQAWVERLKGLGEVRPGQLNRERVVEEGAAIADTLLTMSIRALDYTPPVHVEFGDFLSAVLTSDAEVRPDDSRYQLRRMLLDSFRAYGIDPAGAGDGEWAPPGPGFRYDRNHFEPMRTDPDEVFRFVWENRDPDKLAVSEEAFSRVISVRPSVRVGPDGFVLNEVVAEHIQILNVHAGELRKYGITRPPDMPTETEVTLYGGGALIFDEYGQLKYHVHNSVLNPERQSRRLEYLWDHGAFRRDAAAARRFSNLHLNRAVGQTGRTAREEW